MMTSIDHVAQFRDPVQQSLTARRAKLERTLASVTRILEFLQSRKDYTHGIHLVGRPGSLGQSAPRRTVQRFKPVTMARARALHTMSRHERAASGPIVYQLVRRNDGRLGYLPAGAAACL
jgi:hypothetical protein